MDSLLGSQMQIGEDQYSREIYIHTPNYPIDLLSSNHSELLVNHRNRCQKSLNHLQYLLSAVLLSYSNVMQTTYD